ncbi:MAG: type I glutamate--ammonia ligase, partial [Gemmatimonadota bacterium]|nr:type I glutamate--ammonia ligase [Gemmatimonadota bacterium]
ERRGIGTRVEFRMPDPSCNPYLALAVQLAAGLDGVRREIDPGPPVDTNVWELSEEERAERGIVTLPANLGAAVDALEADEVVRGALGDHVFTHFVDAKRREWSEYIAQVSDWEMEEYLATY